MLTIIFLALLAFGQAIIGLLLFLEARRTKRTDQKLFSILSFTLVLWTLAVGSLSNIDAIADSSNLGYYQLVNRAAFVLTGAILVLFYTFSLYYPFKRSYGTVAKWITYGGITLTALSVFPFFSGTMVIKGNELVYTYGKGIMLIAVFAVTVLIAVFRGEYDRSRASRDKKLRTQTTTLLMGMTLTIVHTLLFVVLLPGLFKQTPILYAIGYAGPYYLVLFTAYGLLQQGLFNIRVIVARSMAYLTTITALSAMYGFLVFGLASVIFELSIPLTTQIFLSVATGIASLSFQRFKKFFDKTTNRVFYQDAYDSEELFDEYNKTLVSTIDLDLLLKRVTHTVVKYMKSSFCLVGVKDGSSSEYRIIGSDYKDISPADIELVRLVTPHIHHAVVVVDDIPKEQETLKVLLQKYDIALLVRLTTNFHAAQEGLGYIALGSKKSGNLYTNQDIKVIEALANELIIALQNALRFEEIERFNETLQKEIDVATRQLRETNAKLRKVDKQKDEFIGMASHQLRTPLTSIKGYVSLVLDGDSGRITATQRKLLEQAFTSSQRMVYLIADLLNVSRLKSGKFVIERAPTNLAKVISDEMAQLKTAASTHNVELTFTPPDDFPSLMLDETKTRQVIMNFLDNAIYYTPTGGHINVVLRDLPKSVEFEVVDDGIGVPKSERHHLFTKFYRAKNAQRARPDGTGLGLFMAQKVIIAQGGAIIFDSKEGIGSKFGFSFSKEMPADSGAPIVIHE